MLRVPIERTVSRGSCSVDNSPLIPIAEIILLLWNVRFMLTGICTFGGRFSRCVSEDSADKKSLSNVSSIVVFS
jgi:hypothetical protein